MAPHSDVLSLNLTQGCVHRCAFCSVRAHPSYRGDQVVSLYTDTAERLAAELVGRRKLPRAVYISPSTDPFPPVAAVQAEVGRVIEVLAANGIEAWLMTRGFIRPAAMRVLAAHRDKVKITFGMTTLVRALQRTLEPLTSSPRLRLRQLVQLRKLGIAAHVAVEPLIPGLTDTRANLEELLEALSRVGMSQITAGYMFLRAGIRDHLLEALEASGWGQAVCEAYASGPVLMAGNIAPARYLPKAQRQRGYASLMSLAAGHGIVVRVSGTTNPDFAPPAQAVDHKSSHLPLLPRCDERYARRA
jgi:DNA repair photolyase